MGVPVRINEDNYIRLKSEADNEHRSVVGQLNRILDEHYGSSTVGITQETVNDIANLNADSIRYNTTLGTPIEETEYSTRGEKICCGKSKPCVHWQWDDSLSVWVNTLSNRRREQ